jgi:hypothetical protein
LEKFEILLGPMTDLMRKHHDLLVTLVQTAAHSGFLEKTLEITLAVMRCIPMRIQQDAIAPNPADAWAEDHPEGEVLGLVTWKDNSEFHIVIQLCVRRLLHHTARPLSAGIAGDEFGFALMIAHPRGRLSGGANAWASVHL